MTAIYSLWLPILVSAVAVYIVSTVIHMVLWHWHKGDFARLPDEDRFMDAVRPLSIPPGDYMVPKPQTMDEMKSQAFQQKRARGPVAIMTVMPAGAFSMGKPLALWFVFCLVVSFFAAYVTGSALAPGTVYLKVFQIAGTTAFVAYTFAIWPISIWYGRKWSATIRSTIDGLIYALVTAGIFGWLWPR